MENMALFIFADSGLEQNPNPERLAAIAASSAETFQLLVQKETSCCDAFSLYHGKCFSS